MAVVTDKFRKPSEEFRGLATLSELKAISDNPHLFAVYEKICEEVDAGLSMAELKEFLRRLRNICEH